MLNQKRTLVSLILTFFGLFFLSWALATPIGSSADDNYHLPSIWCSPTAIHSLCTKSEKDYIVPDQVSGNRFGCYIQHEPIEKSRYDINATCIENSKTSPATSHSSYLNNLQHLYPPVFYDISAIFVGHSVHATVISIRIFWALTFLLFLAAAFFYSSPRDQKFLGLTIILFVSPVFTFVVTSTNPSSGEIIGIAFLPIFLRTFIEREAEKLFWMNGTVLFFSDLIGAGSRADGGIYASIIFVLSYLAVGDKNRTLKFRSKLFLCLIMAMNLCFVISAQESKAGVVGLTGKHPYFPVNWELLFHNIIGLPEYIAGFWGFQWGIGWKFEPPISNTIAGLQAFLLMCFGYQLCKKMNRRNRLLFSASLFTLCGMVLLILQLSSSPVGEIVQPRYTLPFALSIMVFGIVFSKEDPRSFTRKYFSEIFLCAGILFIIVNFIVLRTELIRLVNGLSRNSMQLHVGRSWWWPGFVATPEAIFLLSVISSIAIVVLSLVYFNLEVKSKSMKSSKNLKKESKFKKANPND
jgi:Predicted membrane protein (DUF2142)